MTPNKKHIAKLAKKWEQKTITPEEELELNLWYREHQDDRIELPADFARSEHSHEQRIWNAIQHEIAVEPVVLPLFKRHWFRTVAAAAAIIMVVATGILFYTQNTASTTLVAENNEVVPGKVGATLVLANGKKVKLSEAADGELAKEAGVIISKSKNGELIYEIKADEADPDKVHTLYTSNGETYTVRLPDGSVVWLNAASSLSYPANLLKDGRRSVTLKGEGYFEVAKDKAHPFVVETDRQKVEVLGTHFNVNAYSDERDVKTTLLEGSVKVNMGAVQKLLRPGEQAVNSGTAIIISKVDMESVTDWKHGDFIFKDEDFKTAMRKIARWYDLEVVYAPDLQTRIEPGGWISRKSKLSAVLGLIEAAGNVHFKVEGRRVTVTN